MNMQTMPTQLKPSPVNSPLGLQASPRQTLAAASTFANGQQCDALPFSDCWGTRPCDWQNMAAEAYTAGSQKPQSPWVQQHHMQNWSREIQETRLDQNEQQPFLHASQQHRQQSDREVQLQQQLLQQQFQQLRQHPRQQVQCSAQSCIQEQVRQSLREQIRQQEQLLQQQEQQQLILHYGKGFVEEPSQDMMQCQLRKSRKQDKLPVQLQSLLPEHSARPKRQLPMVPRHLDMPVDRRNGMQAHQGSVQTGLFTEHEAGVSRTTVMLRDLPERFTREALLALIDSAGFTGKYCFVYLPMAFDTGASLGYAFIDLNTPHHAESFVQHFAALESLGPNHSSCKVSWNNKHHGLEQHIERYRNSPVMHSTVPDGWKPVIFLDGVRVPFPSPTKSVRPPKFRGCHREV